MATWDDVRALALAMPETEEVLSRGDPTWRVDGRMFAWERPLRRRDLEELGDAAPDGPILGVSVADEGEKLALIDSDRTVFFTTSHFDGYAAVLLRLDAIARDRLAEVIGQAWVVKAPPRLHADYLP